MLSPIAFSQLLPDFTDFEKKNRGCQTPSSPFLSAGLVDDKAFHKNNWQFLNCIQEGFFIPRRSAGVNVER